MTGKQAAMLKRKRLARQQRRLIVALLERSPHPEFYEKYLRSILP